MKRFTSFHLKVIAITAMAIDHIAKVFGQGFVSAFFPDSLEASYTMFQLMEVVGRLTFPIMAFFIAEGCRKTSSIKKYIYRLFGFAILSQIPYTLAFNAYHNSFDSENPYAQLGTHLTFFDIGSLNILFTLGFGALAILVFEKLNRKPVSYILAAIIIFSAGFLRLEYSFLGVLLIFAAYALPTRKLQLFGMAVVLSLMYLVPGNGLQNALNMLSAPRPLAENILSAIMSLAPWFGALASLLLLFFYNGERGKSVKYLFYIFYPAHLLLLVAIREVIRC